MVFNFEQKPGQTLEKKMYTGTDYAKSIYCYAVL